MIGVLIADLYSQNSDDKKLSGVSILTLAFNEIAQKFARKGEKYISVFLNNIIEYHSIDINSYERVIMLFPIGFCTRSLESKMEILDIVSKIINLDSNEEKLASLFIELIHYALLGKDKTFIKKYVDDYFKDFDFSHNYHKLFITAINLFLESNSFEDCLKQSLIYGDNRKNLAMISCAISEAYYKHIDKYRIDQLLNHINNETLHKSINNTLLEYLEYRTYTLVNVENICVDSKILSIEMSMYGRRYLRFNCNKQLHILIDLIVEVLLTDYPNVDHNQLIDLHQYSDVDFINDYLKAYCLKNNIKTEFELFDSPISIFESLSKKNPKIFNKICDEIFNNYY